jgi:alkylation response protein AidB-like acyl-CoA dehydrogenase
VDNAELTKSTAQAETVATKAARLSRIFADRAARHDAEGTFVSENYVDLRAASLIEAGVPSVLGGGGAALSELCEMLRVLAHGCSSTALAFAMHTHQVAIPAWRWLNTPEVRPAVEPLLKRVAVERIVLATSGGSDWVGGSGKAEKVEGGYRISARKIFASGSPAATLLITGAVVEEADGPKVIHFAVPMDAPGLTLLNTWDAMGMRGTGSQDIELADVFVPDDKISLKRKAGEWHKLFQIVGTLAFPLIYSAYLGVAESARDISLGLAAQRVVGGRQRRIAGEMDTALASARHAQAAMVARTLRNDPGESSINEIMICRRLVEEQGLRAVELAMELAGGAGFYRANAVEQRFRDMQGARFHAMNRESQHEYAGALAFGQPVANIF